MTHFNRRRAGFRSSIKAGTSTVSWDPSAFSSTSCDARPWPEKWTRSHPSPSLRIVLRASRVTPYWSTRKSIARPAVRAIERIVSLSVYRSCRRFRAPAPVGRLKTASIRNRLTVGSLSRGVAPAGRTSTTRLTSCSARGLPSTWASSSGRYWRPSASFWSAGSSTRTVIGVPCLTIAGPTFPSTCSPAHAPTCPSSSVVDCVQRPGSACCLT